MNSLSSSKQQYLSNLAIYINEYFTSSMSTVLRYGNYYKYEVYLMIGEGLTRQVPHEFEKMVYLEALDVRNNHLSNEYLKHFQT